MKKFSKFSNVLEKLSNKILETFFDKVPMHEVMGKKTTLTEYQKILNEEQVILNDIINSGEMKEARALYVLDKK